MAMNSPNIYDSLALYRAGAQDGRPYGKALGLYEFAGNNTILEACTAREADSLPYSWRMQMIARHISIFRLPEWSR